MTVTESFLFGFSPTSHPRLANYKAFATVYFVFKIGHKLTSNEARKGGLVTVVSLGVVSGEASASPTSNAPNEKGFATVTN